MAFCNTIKGMQRYSCISTPKFVTLLLLNNVCSILCFPIRKFKRIATEYSDTIYRSEYVIERFLEQSHLNLHGYINRPPMIHTHIKPIDSGTIDVYGELITWDKDTVLFNVNLSDRCLSIPLDVLKPLLVQVIAHIQIQYVNIGLDITPDIHTEIQADAIALLNGYDIEHSLKVMFNEQLLTGNLLVAYMIRKRLKALNI